MIMLKNQSKIVIKVLGYFLINPKKKYYINELAKNLEIDPGNLFRKLKELEEEGILISEKKGNQRYYGLNKEYHLLKEIKQYYKVKYGVDNLIKEKLKEVEKINEAYIFGSYAKGTISEESDIDVLLVGDHSPIDAKRKILPLQRSLGREINIIDLSLEEFKEKKKEKDEFIENIFSEKIIKIL
jgi:predicted nucleotidyltransferase